MSDGGSAAAIDRLPWLEDEPERTGKGRHAVVWALVPLLLLGVAGLSYWLGKSSADEPTIAPAAAPPEAVSTTVPLPEPVIEPSAPPTAVAEPAPVAAPPVRKGRVTTRPVAAPPAKRVVPAAKAEAPRKLTYWPAMTSAGASGRMVRIGTFASRAQAKTGWRKVMSVYPGMKRIPTAVVGAPSKRDGRMYYRLQMGTTSQAHSEVLCQRMRIIGQSCIVVGLDKAAS